jgi:hypothetical protein
MLEQIFDRYDDLLVVRREREISVGGVCLPIYSAVPGKFIASRPTLLITAGIHGLERIGTSVVLAFMETLLSRFRWDPMAQHLVANLNIVLAPLMNPGGMWLNTRANPNGVDLMRNAPIEAEQKPPLLLGGQRFSRYLPWYCGQPNQAMEIENQVLLDIVERCTCSSPFTIVIDCHSGFGFKDRIWFPYAYRRRPLTAIDKLMALRLLLDKTYPNHHYTFEPQALSYTARGDLWDYLYKRHKHSQKVNKQQQNSNHAEALFIPLTLEMGSWNWVKKRPLQMFSATGLFNPIVPHRHSRVLRRHIMLFDFLCSAAVGFEQWLPAQSEQAELVRAAKSLWYGS